MFVVDGQNSDGRTGCVHDILTRRIPAVLGKYEGDQDVVAKLFNVAQRLQVCACRG